MSGNFFDENENNLNNNTNPAPEPIPQDEEKNTTSPTEPVSPAPENTVPPVSGGYTYTPYNPAPAPAPKKKAKNGMSAGAVAVLCICTLLLSCASGFFGAYLATADMNTTPQADSTPGESTDPSVIYQSANSPTSGMSADGGTSSYYNVANLVKDTVVEITTEYVISDRFQYITSGAGSGVIITQDGYVLTNNHVIVDDNGDVADTITVRLTNGKEYAAKVIGTDSDSDIAVIKIDGGEELFPCAVMGDSDKLAVGEEVIAVGNPLGELGGTVTNGIISALDREVNVDGTLMNLLQTNAAINPGNSGGGLFNMAGELVGVVNAKSSGTGIEGLGFAIPINDAVNISEQLITQGYVSGKPWLGITFYQASNFSQALYYNLPSLGIYVVEMQPGLNDTVFQIRDRIIAMDGKEVSTISDISTLIKTYNVGDTITFSVYRNGRLIEVNATCYEYTPDIQFDK